MLTDPAIAMDKHSKCECGHSLKNHVGSEYDQFLVCKKQDCHCANFVLRERTVIIE